MREVTPLNVFFFGMRHECSNAVKSDKGSIGRDTEEAVTSEVNTYQLNLLQGLEITSVSGNSMSGVV